MLRPAAWGGAAETAPRTKPSLARGQEGGSKSGVVLMMLGHHLGVVERIRTLGRAFPPEARPGEIEQGGWTQQEARAWGPCHTANPPSAGVSLFQLSLHCAW